MRYFCSLTMALPALVFAGVMTPCVGLAQSSPPELEAVVTPSAGLGTAAIELVDDSLHLQFEHYFVPRGQRVTWNHANIDFGGVEGWSFAIISEKIKGYSRFNGPRNVRVSGAFGEHKFQHQEGFFEHTIERSNPLEFEWSRCGQTRFNNWPSFHIITGDLDTGETFDMSYLGLSPERTFGYHYKLEWKRCRKSETANEF